ncbi:hypothetical protein ACFE04_004237 [Oxalis oulophora]
MCEHCGGQQLFDSGDIKEDINEICIKLIAGGTISCKACAEKLINANSDNFCTFLTPTIISPTISLSSSDRSLSTCDISVDANTCYRERTSSESSQEDVIYRLNGILQTSSFGVQKTSAESQFIENINSAEIWEFPAPKDPNEDLETSVAYNDEDDDDCGDGTKWGQPTNLSHFEVDGNENYKYKQAEKQRAFEGVLNGRFKDIANHLLKSVGVISSENNGENWLDIVTSLSWEAASYLKADAIDCKTMDPTCYVKVKCIATGSRSQSEVIKGLVFKKHAAHKRMPNKYEKPRLLLMKGFLGQSSELSSLDSIEQEKDKHKYVIEMIEKCHPNVVLVEKSVSLDVQEAILAKKMTLVLDMKLHRLERIARYTGSQILSPDTMMNQKLKQCGSFCIEKFVEDLNEGGKRTCKTLMFIEGCPTRLGCTILLKGSNSDELKRIKSVVRGAILIAYHFILETSFLVDRNIMFSTISLEEETASLHDPFLEDESPVEDGLQVVDDVPIGNGNHEEYLLNPDQLKEGVSYSSVEAYNSAVSDFASISAYLQSAYKGCEQHNDEDSDSSKTLEISDRCSTEDNCNCCDEEKSLAEGAQEQSSSTCSDDNVRVNGDCDNEKMDCMQEKKIALNSQSVLVLMSKKNALKGTICEQNRFSRITFYSSFDVPLGKFLSENLLNQTTKCKNCKELPEAHLHYYSLHNRQLTVQVKHLTTEKGLPGETEGKMWMWSRCRKCKIASGNSKPTKRVLLSNGARGLSFGKFLELIFTNQSFTRSTTCGHSLDNDFLYFFGLGHMVAMFGYSPITTYTVSLPNEELIFRNSIRDDCLTEKYGNVYNKGIQIFFDVSTALKEIKSKTTCSTHKLQELGKDFSEIEDMLQTERSEFEGKMKNAFSKNGNTNQADHRLLILNCFLWEVLLEAFVWEKRLSFLLSPDSVDMCGTKEALKDKTELKKGDTAGSVGPTTEVGLVGRDKISSDNGSFEVKINFFAEANECSVQEIPICDVVEGTECQDDHCHSTEDTEKSPLVALCPSNSSMPESSDSPPHHLQMDRTNAISTGIGKNDLSSDSWFWLPFSEIQQLFLQELQRGHFPKFESDSRLTVENFSRIHQLISEESSRLHISLGTDNSYIVSDYEGEISSIIACALALLNDTEFSDEDKRREIAREAETLFNFIRFPSMSESVHSNSSTSDNSHVSSFDGMNLLKTSHSREVSLGVTKTLQKGKYSVTCLYADKFKNLRKQCCPSEIDFIASLSRCKTWDAKGGKSKCVFSKTLDDRFIIKEIKKTEYDSFNQFGEQYFKHMTESLKEGNPTCLAKVLGVYQVIVRHGKSGKELRHDMIMVMENLAYCRNITRLYDLKGALHARYIPAADGSENVLLDQNFVKDMISSPLYVSRKAKSILERALWNDTKFLNSINVMDYSLLVGVDAQKRELVCGIIDYLRQYTLDKQVETLIKSSLVVPKDTTPTVICPFEYKKRFRKFMSTNFLSVPNDWCSQRSADARQLCGPSPNDSPRPIQFSHVLSVKSRRPYGKLHQCKVKELWCCEIAMKDKQSTEFYTWNWNLNDLCRCCEIAMKDKQSTEFFRCKSRWFLSGSKASYGLTNY